LFNISNVQVRLGFPEPGYFCRVKPGLFPGSGGCPSGKAFWIAKCLTCEFMVNCRIHKDNRYVKTNKTGGFSNYAHCVCVFAPHCSRKSHSSTLGAGPWRHTNPPSSGIVVDRQNDAAPLAAYDALPASSLLPEKAATITHLDLMNALMYVL
jgi:hypothetical protein